jgi:CDP-diacylglycerol--glycerol-3-phosphate 3-phosphatidyltransferase
MTDQTRPRAAGWRARTPNALTISRLALTAVFIALLAGASPGDAGWSPGLLAATAIFVVAAITDALDGFLARRWNAVSRFGRVADPFADKVLILAGFIMLAGPQLGPHSGVASWMVVLVLARELLVTTIRGVYEAEGVDFSATASGKLKMVIQSIVIPVALLDAAAPNGHSRLGPHPATEALLWLTVAVTVWSAAPYIARAHRARKQLGASPGSDR